MDALAASEAASKGLSGNGDRQEDPLKILMRNIIISMQTTFSRVVTRARQIKNFIKRGLVFKMLKKWTGYNMQSNSPSSTAGTTTSTTTTSPHAGSDTDRITKEEE